MKITPIISWSIGVLGILLLINTVSAAVPTASFIIVLNDTSENSPISWQWNATNLLGNNTPVTFSTEQNPELLLNTGNWLIQLLAANSMGSNLSEIRTLGIDISGTVTHYWNRVS